MSLTDLPISVFTSRGPARVLEAWRDAERLVTVRWETFLAAEAENRTFAFAAFVAALDAEEAAAQEMADLVMATAA